VNLRIFKSSFFATAVRWWLVAGTVLDLHACAVADSVTDWNETALACKLTAKQPSYAAARTMAMVHLAMFDAVNSIEHGYAPYKTNMRNRKRSSLAFG